jgi:hypothetical protein
VLTTIAEQWLGFCPSLLHQKFLDTWLVAIGFRVGSKDNEMAVESVKMMRSSKI